MRKSIKRILTVLFALGCLQILFSEEDYYYEERTVYLGISYVDYPHQGTDENGASRWIGINDKNEEEFLDLNTDKNSPDYQDPTKSDTYEKLGYTMPQTPKAHYKLIKIRVPGKKATQQDLDNADKYEIVSQSDLYKDLDQVCDDKRKEADDIIKANDEKEDEENNKNIEDNQKAGAEEAIDPVLLTSGQYVFTENDLKITIHGITYNIGRFYNSGKKIADNLGENWYFTLDSRVILGYRNNIIKEEKDIQQKYNNANQIYNDTCCIKEKIIEKYDKEINLSIKNRQYYQDQIDAIEKDPDASYMTDVTDFLKQIVNKYGSRIKDYEDNKKIEENAINKILSSQKETLDELNERLTETKNKLHHYEINQSYNTSLLEKNFNQNLNSGNDVIFIYDEKGTAWTYRLLAKPDYSREEKLYPNGSPTENLIPGDYSTVILNADGTVTWHRKDNQIWIYGSNGLIKRMENLAGVGIDINYNGDKLESISFNGEVLYKFYYVKDRLEIIENSRDPQDKVVYSYDFQNRLQTVTDSEGDTVTYDYTTDDRLCKIIKPDNSCIEIKYEAIVEGPEKTWASESIDEEGVSQTLSYNVKKTVTETDGSGKTKTYVYNADHNIKEEQYPDGTKRVYEYNEDESLKSESYCGTLKEYGYDNKGNITSITYTDSTGKSSTETFEYNKFNQVKKYIDRDGFEVFYEYDEIGNLLFIRKGSEYVFKGLQYEDDLLKMSEDALGVIRKYDYDKYGNIQKVTTVTSDPKEEIYEEYEYDERNRIKFHKDAEGNETTYVHTNKTRTETYSNGLVRTYTYNNRKDLVEIKEEDSILKKVRIKKLKYDKKHNLLEVTDPAITDKNGNPIPLEKYTYRGNNELESVTYSDGKDFWKTTYEFDDAGRVTGKKTEKNESESSYQEKYEYPEIETVQNWKKVFTGEVSGVRYDYDDWGRIKAVTNAIGETSERVLSDAGRTLKENSSHGGSYVYEYTNGNLTGLGEENKKQVKTEYYADGTVKAVTDRLGNKTEYFYNIQGLLEKIVSKENTTWYTYDKAGRITGQYITEPDAISYKSNVDSYITYIYKDSGRTVVATYGGVYSKTMKLNAFGEVEELIDGEGNSVKYEYDTLGRQTAVYDGYNKSTKYEYNALGLVSKVTYRDGTSERYEYDCLGNVIKVTDAEGTKAVYVYDETGRMISVKERGSALTEYTYDNLDRVTQVKLAGEVIEKYEYTPHSRKTTVTDGNGNKYQYNYDEFGRLKNETNRLEDSQYYSYDEEGSLNKKKDFNAKTTSYEYDSETRTKTTYYADGSKTVYEYSPAGNLIHVTGETGTISYSYNKAGLPVSQVDHGAGETTYYTYNKAGLKSKVQSDSRTLVYTYGKNSEIKKVEDYTTKMTVTLGYDVMGREIKRLYKNGISENTSYDNLGRVILKTEIDSYGNLYFAESYVYNSEGQRSLTVSGSGEVTVYKYNERGEIESVYYPYSESLELAAKKEALEAGLYPKYPEYEWYAYSGEESILIKKAFERIYKNLPYLNLRGQHVWSEHYTYDNNSNRITKTTQYGTINYTYDDENRLRYSGREKLVNLEEEIGGRITFRENDEIYHAATNDSVSYSTNSLRGTRFTYDKNGNMLSSENLYSVKFFDYNATNRMKLSTVTDLTEHSYTATTYAYDGFGRRTLTQTEGHTANRTLYDGTGFEILRQGTADSNGSFVNYTEAQNRYSPYYPYNGGGYYGNRYGYADYFYYLFFGGIWGFGNGGHGSKNGQEEAPEYLTIENMYPLYANGSVSGTFKEDLVYSPHKHYWNSWTNLWGADTSRYDDYATYKETLYFGTDVLGSVRTTSSYSVFDFGSINYDVFGSPYRRTGSFLNTESLDFGYLGKPYNATTELYDYGFRDYSPRNARFTTVDPIRDGRNWYTYVLNDPVNYVDLWGLSRDCDQTTGNLSDNYSVQYKDFGSSFIDLFTNRNKKYEKFNDYKIDKFIKQKEFNYYLENPEELPSDKVVLYRQKGKKFEYCIATITEYGKMSKNEKIDIILNEYNTVLREFDYNRTDLINTYKNLGYGLGEALFQASSNSSIQEFVGNYILYNLDNLTELLHGDIDTINNIRDLKYLENKLKYVMENY